MDKIQASTTAAAPAKQGKSMQAYIKSMEGEIKKALPSVITPERQSAYPCLYSLGQYRPAQSFSSCNLL